MRRMKYLLFIFILLTSLNVSAVSLRSEVQALESSDSSTTQKLLVKKFILKGFKAYPEKNITLQNLDSIFRRALKYHNNQLSLDDIYTITDYISSIYSAAGLSFHQINIPPQEVVNNTVTLVVVEGVLGDVLAFPNKTIDQAFLSGVYAPYYRKALDQQEIEEATLLLNETPGLEVFSYYSRGSQRGESRINVRVQDTQQWQGSLRADNHGNENTGKYRLMGTFIWNRPFMSADELSLGIMQSARPENNLYGSLSYRAPVVGYRTFLGFMMSNNEFDLGGDFVGLDVNGSSSIIQVDLLYKQARSSHFNQSFSFLINTKSSDLENSVTNTLLTQDQSTQGFGANWFMNYTAQDNVFRSYSYLSAYSGKYQDGFSVQDGETFSKMNFGNEMNWQLLTAEHTFFSDLRFKFALQSSSDDLPSFEKAILTGPFAVRAFDSGVSSVDEAYVVSLDLTLLNPVWTGRSFLSRYLRPYLFFDIASGTRNNIATGIDSEIDVAGYGFGLFYQLDKQLTGNISFAQSSTYKIDSVEQNIDETRVLFDMYYRF